MLFHENGRNLHIRFFSANHLLATGQTLTNSLVVFRLINFHLLHLAEASLFRRPTFYANHLFLFCAAILLCVCTFSAVNFVTHSFTGELIFMKLNGSDITHCSFGRIEVTFSLPDVPWFCSLVVGFLSIRELLNEGNQHLLSSQVEHWRNCRKYNQPELLLHVWIIPHSVIKTVIKSSFRQKGFLCKRWL